MGGWGGRAKPPELDARSRLRVESSVGCPGTRAEVSRETAQRRTSGSMRESPTRGDLPSENSEFRRHPTRGAVDASRRALRSPPVEQESRSAPRRVRSRTGPPVRSAGPSVSRETPQQLSTPAPPRPKGRVRPRNRPLTLGRTRARAGPTHCAGSLVRTWLTDGVLPGKPPEVAALQAGLDALRVEARDETSRKTAQRRTSRSMQGWRARLGRKPAQHRGCLSGGGFHVKRRGGRAHLS